MRGVEGAGLRSEEKSRASEELTSGDVITVAPCSV